MLLICKGMWLLSTWCCSISCSCNGSSDRDVNRGAAPWVHDEFLVRSCITARRRFVVVVIVIRVSWTHRYDGELSALRARRWCWRLGSLWAVLIGLGCGRRLSVPGGCRKVLSLCWVLRCRGWRAVVCKFRLMLFVGLRCRRSWGLLVHGCEYKPSNTSGGR
jgi:hypothetical protein